MKTKAMKERFSRFIDGLSEEEVRHELLQAYLQMERCQRVLEGRETSPVTMRDNGLSSDLELFYMCRKRMAELKGEPESKESAAWPEIESKLNELESRYCQRNAERIARQFVEDTERMVKTARKDAMRAIVQRSPYIWDEVFLIAMNLK